ncbi:GOLPH3/VPS74 family protein [Plantactinospora sp. CA-290183]|uniref:GOLPH3/VPS74 family protein n=1 Tax=Plantactinospora sp. CA-290183 TaxID=3240006 RepID=UPI003D925A77
MTDYPGQQSERLADELFLIAHDDYSGKPLTAANPLDTALAGAILGELILDERVGIARSQVYVADRRPWREPVSDRVLAEIVRRGDGHLARSWLEFLAPRVRDHVGDRLVNAGAVRRTTVRGLNLRTRIHWPGLDPNRVARPRVRLTAMLERSEQPLDARTATLAGLVRAGGLIRALIPTDRSMLAERIAAARRLLPTELAELLNAVEAVLGNAPATARR